MNPNRIKLLVTLVLFTLAATCTWFASQADARGLSSPGTSSHLVATRPGPGLVSGDPDDGQGVAPPPPLTPKTAVMEPGRGTLANWVRWTGRIWATLYLRSPR